MWSLTSLETRLDGFTLVLKILGGCRHGRCEVSNAALVTRMTQSQSGSKRKISVVRNCSWHSLHPWYLNRKSINGSRPDKSKMRHSRTTESFYTCDTFLSDEPTQFDPPPMKRLYLLHDRRYTTTHRSKKKKRGNKRKSMNNRQLHQSAGTKEVINLQRGWMVGGV
jgi:hypothetical protein